MGLLVALQLAARAAAGDEPRPHPRPRAELRFEDGSDKLLVPVEFDGSVYRFDVDTGSYTTVVGPPFRGRLGPVVRRTTAQAKDGNGDFTVEWFKAPNALVGGLPLGVAFVPLYSLSDLNHGTDRQFDGILGADFLSRFVAQFDFDAGRLLLYDELPPDAGEPFRFADRTAPEITAQIAGTRPREFRIDTGGKWSIDVDPAIFEQGLAQGGIDQPYFVPVGTTNGTIIAQTGRTRSLQVGRFTHGELSTIAEGNNALGLRYLRRYLLTIDFPRKTLYLKKGRAFAAPERLDCSGLFLVRSGDEIVIDHLELFSPGVESGCQPYDVLLEADGLPATRDNLSRIRRMLEEEGKTVSLRVRRDGKTLSMKLALRNFRDRYRAPPRK